MCVWGEGGGRRGGRGKRDGRGEEEGEGGGKEEGEGWGRGKEEGRGKGGGGGVPIKIPIQFRRGVFPPRTHATGIENGIFEFGFEAYLELACLGYERKIYR